MCHSKTCCTSQRSSRALKKSRYGEVFCRCLLWQALSAPEIRLSCACCTYSARYHGKCARYPGMSEFSGLPGNYLWHVCIALGNRAHMPVSNTYWTLPVVSKVNADVLIMSIISWQCSSVAVCTGSAMSSSCHAQRQSSQTWAETQRRQSCLQGIPSLSATASSRGLALHSTGLLSCG